MKAWHFLGVDRKLRHGDERDVNAGQVYTTEQPPILCRSGMHGSVKLLDALECAPGPVVCRVDITGDVIKGDDKLVGRSRKVLWMYDATEVLRAFSRKCALDVIHLWDAPPVVVEYLKTGNENIRDAAAAYATAYATAYAAAANATAATAATTAAAAANAAVNAGAAAGVAHESLRDKQSRRLYRMIMEGRIR